MDATLGFLTLHPSMSVMPVGEDESRSVRRNLAVMAGKLACILRAYQREMVLTSVLKSCLPLRRVRQLDLSTNDSTKVRIQVEMGTQKSEIESELVSKWYGRERKTTWYLESSGFE